MKVFKNKGIKPTYNSVSLNTPYTISEVIYIRVKTSKNLRTVKAEDYGRSQRNHTF